MNSSAARFGSISRKVKAKLKKTPCIFCNNTERVEVWRAQRYMEAATGVSPLIGATVSFAGSGVTSHGFDRQAGTSFAHSGVDK